MARRNSRGLELSFKRYAKGRTDGRWFKIIDGKPLYFGTGNGVSDRSSYQAALTQYRVHQGQQAEADLVAKLGEVPRSIAAMTWTQVGSAYSQWRDSKQKPSAAQIESELPHLQQQIMTLTGGKKVTTIGSLITDFIDDQHRRNKRRHFIDTQKAKGEKVKAAKGETIGDEYLASLIQWVEKLRVCVAGVQWDGSDRAAATMLKRWRDESEEAYQAGGAAQTFNQRMKVVRLFIEWAYTNYHLEHLPRNLKKLVAKFDCESTAKAIPLDTHASSPPRRRCASCATNGEPSHRICEP